jgi:hypothetical protein
MKNLSTLSPAQTLILLEGKDANLRDLLKVTLMDLFLKQVLQTTEIANTSHAGSETFSNTYIIRGNNFLTYNALAQEEIFLSVFRHTENAQFLFNTLVKLGYEKAGSVGHYSKIILRNSSIRPYFVEGIERFFKGKFSLTPWGIKLVRELKAEINELETTLPKLLETDQAKALEVLKVIKGNIFLVKGLDFKMMKEIENQVVAESSNAFSASDSSYPDAFMWLALTTNSSSFDSGCSSSHHHHHDSSDWGGDSDSGGDSGGDSGCSGCGGCGGGD